MPSRIECGVLLGLLALGSLHHVYSSAGPANLKQFLVLQVIAAGGLVTFLARLASRPRAV